MSTLKFAETHNLVAFLEKPKESNGFEGIIDFLNASSIKYVLTIQALVDKKKAIITEKSVRSNLMLEDAEGIECLPNDVIFEHLTLIGSAPEDMGEDSAAPIDSHSTPIITQPSSSKPQKKKSKRKSRGKAQVKDLLKHYEIASLKKRVKQLEKSKKSGTSGLKRLRNVVTLIDETQEIYDEEMLFDVQDNLQGEEVVAEQEVAEKEVSAADSVTTAGEVVTTASATTTVDELTLAQTLIEIKAAKPKAVTTSATIITTAVASTSGTS
ncbi:hypothetical protein Tco_0025579 [Tanacetum coccineum]